MEWGYHTWYRLCKRPLPGRDSALLRGMSGGWLLGAISAPRSGNAYGAGWTLDGWLRSVKLIGAKPTRRSGLVIFRAQWWLRPAPYLGPTGAPGGAWPYLYQTGIAWCLSSSWLKATGSRLLCWTASVKQGWWQRTSLLGGKVPLVS